MQTVAAYNLAGTRRSRGMSISAARRIAAATPRRASLEPVGLHPVLDRVPDERIRAILRTATASAPAPAPAPRRGSVRETVGFAECAADVWRWRTRQADRKATALREYATPRRTRR